MSLNNEESIPLIRTHDDRVQHLKNLFKKKFDQTPDFVVKVPGRVNLIGEHIDYCGFPVLPMALDQNILIAVHTLKEKEIRMKNTNEKYSDINVTLKSSEEVLIEPDEDGKPFWHNYVMCGIKGALEYLYDEFENGMQILVDGNIPPASGLSSSSALVSASCLAFLHAQNSKITKTNIAALCARSERYIGTQGGGMDQAIAFLGVKHSAQYITFLPLEATPVSLPENATFVVAHSLAEANKAATNGFNTRVVECRLAAKVIAMYEQVETGDKIITLSALQRSRDSSLEEMINLVHKWLPKEKYSKNKICKILNLRECELNDQFLTPDTQKIKEFKLKQRALHVYEEALRVEHFRKLCPDPNSGDQNGNSHPDDIINSLGDLMSKSHESLKKLYECSHENLDLLVDLSKKRGVHARLTGAGWGGCIVAICRKEEVPKYIEYLSNKFYLKRCKIAKENVPSYIFSTEPNDGAVIYV